jgi:transcriptional regulator with XRE-family HTH domain
MITAREWYAAQAGLRERMSRVERAEDAPAEPVAGTSESNGARADEQTSRRLLVEPERKMEHRPLLPIVAQLRQERLRRNWSQRWVAEQLGRTTNGGASAQISMYETGRVIPSLPVLVGWARLFGLGLTLAPLSEEDTNILGELACGCPALLGHLGDCPEREAA